MFLIAFIYVLSSVSCFDNSEDKSGDPTKSPSSDRSLFRFSIAIWVSASLIRRSRKAVFRAPLFLPLLRGSNPSFGEILFSTPPCTTDGSILTFLLVVKSCGEFVLPDNERRICADSVGLPILVVVFSGGLPLPLPRPRLPQPPRPYPDVVGVATVPLNVFVGLVEFGEHTVSLVIEERPFTSKNLAASKSGVRFSSDTLVSPQYMNSTKDLSTENFMSFRTINGWLPNCLSK
uniref:Putative secreted protein n=1 Tax=Panstrongylus lignarius TaxID=156445 RepID=A0A224XRU6_9HEMI